MRRVADRKLEFRQRRISNSFVSSNGKIRTWKDTSSGHKLYLVYGFCSSESNQVPFDEHSLTAKSAKVTIV